MTDSPYRTTADRLVRWTTNVTVKEGSITSNNLQKQRCDKLRCRLIFLIHANYSVFPYFHRFSVSLTVFVERNADRWTKNWLLIYRNRTSRPTSVVFLFKLYLTWIYFENTTWNITSNIQLVHVFFPSDNEQVLKAWINKSKKLPETKIL